MRVKYELAQDIVARLDSLFFHDNKYNDIKSLHAKRLQPTSWNRIYNYLPYASHKIDAPTKRRYLTLFGVKARETLCAINLLFNVANENLYLSPYFYLIYAVQLTALICESEILKKMYTHMKLEGYTELFPKYTSWPPTCFGQQLSREMVLYPSNNELNQRLNYMIGVVFLIEDLQKKDMFVEVLKDSILQEKIKELCKFAFHLEDNLDLAQNFSTEANHSMVA